VAGGRKKNLGDPGPPPVLDRRAARHAEDLTGMKAILDQSAHAQRPLDVAGQQPRRRGERTVRWQALAFARWTGRLGWPRCQAAGRMNLRPGTLGRWARAWPVDRLPARPLGRPRRRAEALQRLQVRQHLEQGGPTLGLPALRSAFPDQTRSQLADLQRDYRRHWVHDHQVDAEALEWHVPGSVWAGDFSESPIRIDDDLRHVLAVRDLASRRQLLLRPTPQPDAGIAVATLEHLFIAGTAPLVFKSDNGSPFVAEAFAALLARWQVVPLLSPPSWPAYNGAIEAGFSSAKTRICLEAARHGRQDHWTSDDVEAARQLANCASRPWGPRQPTPEQRWDARTPLGPACRAAFGQAVLRQESLVRLELGCPPGGDLPRHDRAAVAREAIRRALEELGYLSVRRRRITPPFKWAFRAIIR
jgi:hypothetical protein